MVGTEEPGEDLDDFPAEEVVMMTPIEVAQAVPPNVVTEEFSAQMRAREQAIPSNIAFATEGQRRFAEAVARASRGRA